MKNEYAFQNYNIWRIDLQVFYVKVFSDIR